MEQKHDMSDVCIVVPTIRPESFSRFKSEWDPLFRKHKVTLLAVLDGDEPNIVITSYIDQIPFQSIIPSDEAHKGVQELIYNRNDGVRNLGFAYIAKHMPYIEYIVSLDDDCYPYSNDPIQEHLDALSMRVPITWLSTANKYMRGFPYGVRDEAEVVLSHGVWRNVPDYDAPTQLVNGTSDKGVVYYKGTVPKGVLYPHCAMNFAFKRKALPYVYQAPMGYKVGLDRFADIWMGIECKRDLDALGLAVVTGYSTIWHDRASNVWVNLVKEAKGLGYNEKYGEDEYFNLFFDKRKKWKDYISTLL